MCAFFVFVYASFLLQRLQFEFQFNPTTSRIFMGLTHHLRSPSKSCLCITRGLPLTLHLNVVAEATLDLDGSWPMDIMDTCKLCMLTMALWAKHALHGQMMTMFNPWLGFPALESVFDCSLDPSAYQYVWRCFHTLMLRFRNYNTSMLSMRNDEKGW